MTTRSQEVERILRKRLLDGEFPGDSRLNELDLSRALGVSRTPVRAALHTLASEGCLEYRPNIGFVVRSFSAKYVAGVYEVRAALEGLAAQQAAERGLSDARRGRMHRLMEESDALIASGRRDRDAYKELMRINDDFHMAFIEAADNQHLADTLTRTRQIPMIDRVKGEAFDFDFTARAQEDHRWIFEALVNGQGARAEALVREHIRRGAVRLSDFASKTAQAGRGTRAPA